jgi:hypothetical protein
MLLQDKKHKQIGQVSTNTMCHNPSLGLATKAKVFKGAGQDWA